MELWIKKADALNAVAGKSNISEAIVSVSTCDSAILPECFRETASALIDRFNHKDGTVQFNIDDIWDTLDFLRLIAKEDN